MLFNFYEDWGERSYYTSSTYQTDAEKEVVDIIVNQYRNELFKGYKLEDKVIKHLKMNGYKVDKAKVHGYF